MGAPNPTTGVIVGACGPTRTDGDVRTYAVTRQPAFGFVSVWPTGGFIYTPDPRARLTVYTSGIVTVDGFTVTVTDTRGEAVTISVDDVPVHPARAAVVATVPVNADPQAVTLSPDDRRAYVAHAGEAVVSIIDTETSTLIETVVVGDHPQDLSFSADGAWAYVIHRGGDTASVIDTDTHSVVCTVPVGEVPPPAPRTPEWRGAVDRAVGIIGTATNVDLMNLPRSVALNTAGTRAYVAVPAHATVSVVEIATPPE